MMPSRFSFKISCWKGGRNDASLNYIVFFAYKNALACKNDQSRDGELQFAMSTLIFFNTIIKMSASNKGRASFDDRFTI